MFFSPLGGGVKESGWQNSQLSKARQAIVPVNRADTVF